MFDPNENKPFSPGTDPSGQGGSWQEPSSAPQEAQNPGNGAPSADPFAQYRQAGYGQSYEQQSSQQAQQPYQPPEYQPSSYQGTGYQDNSYQAPQYQPAPPYQAYPYGAPEEPRRGSGLSVASMICGILSVVLCCGMWISWILSIVAIVLGVVAINRHSGGRGMAIAGVITGAFGLLLSIGFLIFAVAVGSVGNTMDYSYYSDLF